MDSIINLSFIHQKREERFRSYSATVSVLHKKFCSDIHEISPLPFTHSPSLCARIGIAAIPCVRPDRNKRINSHDFHLSRWWVHISCGSGSHLRKQSMFSYQTLEYLFCYSVLVHQSLVSTWFPPLPAIATWVDCFGRFFGSCKVRKHEISNVRVLFHLGGKKCFTLQTIDFRSGSR